jgi:hypothetical protein
MSRTERGARKEQQEGGKEECLSRQKNSAESCKQTGYEQQETKGDISTSKRGLCTACMPLSWCRRADHRPALRRPWPPGCWRRLPPLLPLQRRLCPGQLQQQPALRPPALAPLVRCHRPHQHVPAGEPTAQRTFLPEPAAPGGAPPPPPSPAPRRGRQPTSLCQ